MADPKKGGAPDAAASTNTPTQAAARPGGEAPTGPADTAPTTGPDDVRRQLAEQRAYFERQLAEQRASFERDWREREERLAEAPRGERMGPVRGQVLRMKARTALRYSDAKGEPKSVAAGAEFRATIEELEDDGLSGGDAFEVIGG